MHCSKSFSQKWVLVWIYSLLDYHEKEATWAKLSDSEKKQIAEGMR